MKYKYQRQKPKKRKKIHHKNIQTSKMTLKKPKVTDDDIETTKEMVIFIPLLICAPLIAFLYAYLMNKKEQEADPSSTKYINKKAIALLFFCVHILIIMIKFWLP